MTPQELKASILQLAIQGKLVEQRSEEGTGEELFQQIQVEKTSWITAGKMKRDKAQQEITPEEVPFDIPDTWKWVRIQDLFNVKSAMRIHQTDWKTSGIPFFRGRELVQLVKTGNVDFDIYISRELYEANKAKGGVPQKDDLLISAVGTLGKVYVVKGTREFYYKDAYILCLENIGKMFPHYVKFALESPYSQAEIRRDSMATTVAQLTIIKAKGLLIPLPPVEEQKRIVAKLEEILPLIDRYEQAWSKLEEFNKRFPVDMQKSILQAAIQGKLVEQRSEEGTGEELYRKIRIHKEMFLAGKKESKLSNEHLKEDEIPFEIPDSWKWVRFGHIMINRDAERIPLSVDERVKLQKKYDYYGASGVIDKVDRYLFDKKLLLIGEDGANLLTRSTPIAFLAHGKYWVNNHAHVLDCNEDLLCMEYIMWFINATNLAPYVTGTAQPKMNQQKMNSIPIALPPLAEQKRIVAKLEEILPLCERLK